MVEIITLILMITANVLLVVLGVGTIAHNPIKNTTHKSPPPQNPSSETYTDPFGTKIAITGTPIPYQRDITPKDQSNPPPTNQINTSSIHALETDALGNAYKIAVGRGYSTQPEKTTPDNRSKIPQQPTTPQKIKFTDFDNLIEQFEKETPTTKNYKKDTRTISLYE